MTDYMPSSVLNIDSSDTSDYPVTTGRFKQTGPAASASTTKVAFEGDSTLDNGRWVDAGKPFAEKTHTVLHQTAATLAREDGERAYELGLFAVDGATTSDLDKARRLNIAFGNGYDDGDHSDKTVNQMQAVKTWQPDVVVLSVGGNNYRVPLQHDLTELMSYPSLLARYTPAEIRAQLKQKFAAVKTTLAREYKQLITDTLAQNSNLKRLVLSSQYYPALTMQTRYFIYTGFSHIAKAQGLGRTAFETVEDTMNELYREVMQHAFEQTKAKDVELVFVDMTSSINPLGDNHSHQIEPNERGAKLMGRMLANAIAYPSEKLTDDTVTTLRLSANEIEVVPDKIADTEIQEYAVKPIKAFIAEHRYQHAGHLFSSSSSLATRYESAWHLIMGKQFDSDYAGSFAWGLLDISLVTILAAYLWRAARYEEPKPTQQQVQAGGAAGSAREQLSMTKGQVLAGMVSSPVLLAKYIVGLALMLALALPILGFHKARYQPEEEQSQTSPAPT